MKPWQPVGVETAPAQSRAEAPAAGDRATAAERVGLVEEDDDTAVAQRELTKLAKQRLHLENAHAEEHVLERARVDEDIRFAGLAGNRLGHQRLACTGWSPQQDSTRDIATFLLDFVRSLQKDDVLLDPVEDMVLAPYIDEPRLDVVGEVGIDARLWT